MPLIIHFQRDRGRDLAAVVLSLAARNKPQSRMGDSRGVVRFGVFELDRRAGEVRKAGVRLSLQPQPFEVLSALVDRPGELVTRDELRRRLWPEDTFVDFQHGLNAAVNRLRETLGDSTDTPRFIETVPRRGYRFVAPVQGAPVVAPGPNPVPERRDHRLAFVVPRLAVVVAVAVVIGGLLLAATGVVDWRWLPPALRSERGSGAARDVSAGGFTLPPMRTVPRDHASGAEDAPSFSPDGTHIAFRGPLLVSSPVRRTVR